MFDIWNIEGIPTQYRVGRNRRPRQVESVEAPHPVSPVSGDDPYARYRAIADEARSRQRIITVEEIMSSPVVVVAPDETIAAARLLIEARRFRHVPVAVKSAAPIGILSDRDVFQHRGNGEDPVLSIMARDVISARPDTSIYDAARLFVEERIGSMPVVKDGQLVGILTRSDILRTVVHAPLDLWS